MAFMCIVSMHANMQQAPLMRARQGLLLGIAQSLKPHVYTMRLVAASRQTEQLQPHVTLTLVHVLYPAGLRDVNKLNPLQAMMIADVRVNTMKEALLHD